MHVGSTAMLITALCATSAAIADVAPADAARTVAAPADEGGLMPARTIHHFVIVYGDRAAASAADLDASHATSHTTTTSPAPSPVRRSCS